MLFNPIRAAAIFKYLRFSHTRQSDGKDRTDQSTDLFFYSAAPNEGDDTNQNAITI